MQVKTLLACRDPEICRALMPLAAERWVSMKLHEANAEPNRLADVIVADSDNLEMLGRWAARPDRPMVVALTPTDDATEHAVMMARGIHAAVYRRLPAQQLARVVTALLQRRRQELLQMWDVPVEGGALSTLMENVIAMARRVARTNASVVLLGETGVGKEWLAQAIHRNGHRSSGPFIAVNCAAIPATLLESELFGHERGAFTGAERARKGFFELAHRGTLFLDEVGEMSLSAQAALLRVLQDGRVRPVGSERQVDVNVRIIAATNRSLHREVEEKRFRADLFYRLSVVVLEIPPLRRRREELPALASAIVRRVAASVDEQPPAIDPSFVERMVSHPWPGNLRELVNIIERAILVAQDGVLLAEHFDDATGKVPPAAAVEGLSVPTAHWLGLPWKAVRREVMTLAGQYYLAQQLRATGGRVQEAANRAALDPRSVRRMMHAKPCS
jgi:DNA-binding NtrC family response regulator